MNRSTDGSVFLRLVILGNLRPQLWVMGQMWTSRGASSTNTCEPPEPSETGGHFRPDFGLLGPFSASGCRAVFLDADPVSQE